MSSYLLESSICLAAFYSFYWLFLHREKLLSINRFYLLGSVLASILIPLLNFETSWTLFSSAQTEAGMGLNNGGELATDTANPAAFHLPLGMIYIAGLTISLAVLVFKLALVKRRLGKNFSFQKKHIEIVEIEEKEAFSFLNTIYIGKELASERALQEQIIAHELAHIDGKHTIDIILFELLKCVYWFNPFSYFYIKSAQLQHEFIADNYALNKSDAKTYQKSLLLFTLSKINPSLISGFGQHPIHKRLKMIQTINSNIMNKLKPLFALPILAALFIAFACTEEMEPTIKDEVEEIVFEEEELVIDLDVEIESIQSKTFYMASDSLTVSENKFGEQEIILSGNPQVIEVYETPISTEQKVGAKKLYEIKLDEKSADHNGKDVIRVVEVPISRSNN